MMAWEPSSDDLDWTRTQLDSLNEGDVWNAGEMQYQRTGDAELTLISRTERAEVAHGRVLVTLGALDWSCVDNAAVITPDDPVEQLLEAQRHAQEWECPECNTPLVDSELESVLWVSHGVQPTLGPDGEEGEVERWLVHLPCSGCDEEVRMNPMDYALIAGDDLFHTFRSEAGLVYCVLSREDMIALIDEEGEGVALGSQGVDGEQLPPHLQGTYCLVTPAPVDEEE